MSFNQSKDVTIIGSSVTYVAGNLINPAQGTKHFIYLISCGEAQHPTIANIRGPATAASNELSNRQGLAGLGLDNMVSSH
jgi:hypothetical protein